MSAKASVALGSALLWIGISAVYLLQLSHVLANTLFLLPPFLSVIAGAYAVRTYRLSNIHGKSIALLTIGLGCFFIGELLFFLFQFVLHTKPFPSGADVFYLAAYPFLFAGLRNEISSHPISWRGFNKLVLVLVVLLLAALSIIVLYFGVYLAYSPGDPLINNSVAIAYGVADLLLIVPSLFILNLTLDYRGGKLFNFWVMVLLALIFLLAGDILFAIYHDKYTALLWPYTLIDVTWVSSYLLFAYGFFYTAATIKELGGKLRPAS